MAGFTTALGFGLAGAGGLFSFFGAQDAAAQSKKQAELEMQIEQQRRQAMELDAQRRKMEIIRNQQRARSMALTVANSQGAQMGSGLAGAYGQISGATGVNYTGVQSNLQIGRNIFDYNALISQSKMAQADAQSMMAMGSGLSQLGSAFVNTSGVWGNQFNNFTKKSKDTFNPWSWSGYY